MKKILFTILLLFSAMSIALAQSGELQVKVLDAANGEPIPFANVAVTIGGSLTGAATDFDGVCTIKPVPPGSYSVEVTYLGYTPKRIEGVLVTVDKITFLDVEMGEDAEMLDVFEVVEYTVPLLKADETSTGNTVTKADIANLPTRNVSSIAAQASGVYQSDEGGGLNVKGSREEATDYYIDGIKVRGSSNLPASAIEQMTVVTGGVPARYGDATGGIINITTRGPSSQFSGGIELITSKFLDPYGYYLGNFSLAGPIIKVNRGESNQRTLLGFFISGEYLHEDDDDPSAIGNWKVKDDVLADLRANPLILNDQGSGVLKTADFVTYDDMELVKAKLFNPKDQISLAAKFDFQPVQNTNITLGGNFNFREGGVLGTSLNNYNRRWELFNYDRTPQEIREVYRGFARFTQRFGGNRAAVEGEEQTSSALSNAYYSVQFDYTKNFFTRQDPIFEDRVFDYGYVGQFETFSEPFYQQGAAGVGDESNIRGWELQNYIDTLTTFTPSDVNPDKAQVTSSFYDLLDGQTDLYTSIFGVRNNGGLINGFIPTSQGTTYSLFYVPGVPYDAYFKQDSEQYRLSFNGSFDVKRRGAADISKHALEFGFEYEQRVDRSHFTNASLLWDIMRLRTAGFGSGIDFDYNNPYLLIDGERIALDDYDGSNYVFSTNDTITYDLIRTDGDAPSLFDYNFRQKFGYGQTDFVSVDSHLPSDFSLDMFSADELLNNGNDLVSYYGYDYAGNKLNYQPSFEEFWTATENINGLDVNTRPIGAFRPVYMAGYIQDKFSFKDLIFNVGLRVDRFDANQKAPKDLYSPLYATFKAGEVSEINGDAVSHPSTIGEDFVVYVDNEVNPTRILGYRDGDEWYDDAGSSLGTDGSTLLSGGNVKPYLAAPLSANPGNDIKDENYDPSLAFEDYEPQITVMPRIAFSFSISDEAIFFAHYDVLAQRPQGRIISTPEDFYFFNERLTSTFNNPNLRAERTIDYQIGFKQKLSSSSALTLSGFYRELKDMVQLTRVLFAYPNDYTTYGNIDFGTVKGLELSYDMRRTNNLRLNLNYTLQFADGTGSGDRSQVNLVDFGQPNLRSIFPLSYDSRHMINLTADYRFSEGAKYNGPVLFGKDILANAGINLIVRARTGTPYSRQANPTPDAQFGVRSSSQLEGTVNGSRLPANLNTNLRIDKDFNIGFGKKEGRSDKYINVYFLVQNLLNTQNVVNVYSFTGSALDDGYVTSAEGQQNSTGVTDTQAFLDQYEVKVQNPNNFSVPRRMRLGLMFNF